MELKEIQSFLNNHTGVQYFDKDLELFKQKFPHSKLIPELDNVQKYNKAQLDERMCYELLTEGGQCIDCMWEHRGFMRDKDGFIVPFQEEDKFEKDLLATDLDGDLKYNDLKALIFGLQLATADNKGATYLAALKDKKAELIEARKAINPPTNDKPMDDEGGKPENTDDNITGKSSNPESTDENLKLSERGNVLVGQTEKKDATNAGNGEPEKKSEGQEQSTQE